ncbi:GNAT family N-acetyltransferase [Desulfosporosinus sp. PR]|uniref:GNAT family N-acetyltransferase n=1 Tax=Candidatus Desulfosporosinus nitrosoreducens TaxID=3401928 RepID=UPI0027F5C3CC|nr:GNAT family N-acetyltransferase [Desulfosporosinus sp. PR]MDQ7092543.1 GNAT family N-acetyltransferase [Desulfosporosinus sp. PR]
MLIRPASEADLTDVINLLNYMDGEEGIDEDKAQEIWRKISDYPYYKVFVAEAKQKIVATCSLIIIENLGHQGAKLALAEGMIVSPEYRGCGLGRQLMQFVLEQAKKENCYKLMLSSNKKRVEAHNFYLRQGFQQHGISFMIDV